MWTQQTDDFVENTRPQGLMRGKAEQPSESPGTAQAAGESTPDGKHESECSAS